MPVNMHRGLGPRPPAPRPAVPAPPVPQMPAAPPPQVPQLNAPQIQAPAPVQAPPVQGGAPGSPGTPGAPGIPGAPVPGGHVAQTNPDLADYLARVRQRLDNPPSDERAMSQLGQSINQFAQGQRNTATLSAAQRGVLGNGGAQEQISDDIGARAQGDFARGAESIAIQRMRDNDAFLAGAQGAFAEPGRQNLADRGIGVQAAGQQGQHDIARARMALDANMANANMANQVAQQNWAAQLEAQRMAQAQQIAMYQAMANLYR